MYIIIESYKGGKRWYLWSLDIDLHIKLPLTFSKLRANTSCKETYTNKLCVKQKEEATKEFCKLSYEEKRKLEIEEKQKRDI